MNFDFLKPLNALPAQDRQRLQWLLAVLVLILVWTFNVAPALKTWREAPALLLQLEAQTQSVKAMQAQAQSLQKAARLSSADAASQLQQSVAEVLGSGAKLSLEGSRATLTLSGVSAENLAQFLTTARTKSHALPLEAHLQKFENANANANANTNANSNGNAPAKTKSSGATQLWRGTLILNLPSN